MNRRNEGRYLRLDLKIITPYIKNNQNKLNLTFTVDGKKTEVPVRLMDDAMMIGHETIPLEKPPCNYGGSRYWFNCPHCYSRKRVLYITGDGFKCRDCLNLVYRSQQITKAEYWEWYFKAQKVANRIDPGFDAIELSAGFNGLWPSDFPQKPKYMKYAKYDKWRQEFIKYASIGNSKLEQSTTQLLKRIEGIERLLNK